MTGGWGRWSGDCHVTRGRWVVRWSGDSWQVGRQGGQVGEE